MLGLTYRATSSLDPQILEGQDVEKAGARSDQYGDQILQSPAARNIEAVGHDHSKCGQLKNSILKTKAKHADIKDDDVLMQRMEEFTGEMQNLATALNKVTFPEQRAKEVQVNFDDEDEQLRLKR